MTRNALFLSALIGFTFLTPALVWAQDKTAAPAEKPADVKKEAPKAAADKSIMAKPPAKGGPAPGTPLAKWIDAENAVIDPLGDRDKQSFLILRRKFSYINAVRVVERDIGNAVESCAKKNPDMKDKMEGRYKQWQGAIDPILDTAKTTLDRDIDNQKIVAPEKVRNVLKLHQAAYEDGEKKTTKIPVTSKEACLGLLDSMDRTEDNMVQLLQQTLLPESVIRSRSEKEDKARAAAAKVKPARKAGDVPGQPFPKTAPEAVPPAGAQLKPVPEKKAQ